MSQPMDIIPVLTDIVEDEPGAAPPIDRTTLFLDELESRLSVAIHEHAGATRFVDAHRIASSAGPRSRRTGSSCARAGRTGRCPSPAPN